MKTRPRCPGPAPAPDFLRALLPERQDGTAYEALAASRYVPEATVLAPGMTVNLVKRLAAVRDPVCIQWLTEQWWAGCARPRVTRAAIEAAPARREKCTRAEMMARAKEALDREDTGPSDEAVLERMLDRARREGREDRSLRLRIWPRRWTDKNKSFRADIESLPDGELFADHRLRLELATTPAP